MAKAKTKTKNEAPADEVEVELEDLDETVEETETTKKGKAQEVTFGVSDLAKYLSEKTGKTITPRDLRTQIRRMAREEKPRVNREVVPGNRSRYDWPDGLKDPEVKAIIKAVTAGELEEGKKAALEKLKADKAAKKAAEGNAGKKGKGKGKGKKAPADDEPEVEEIDLGDDED